MSSLPLLRRTRLALQALDSGAVFVPFNARVFVLSLHVNRLLTIFENVLNLPLLKLSLDLPPLLFWALQKRVKVGASVKTDRVDFEL